MRELALLVKVQAIWRGYLTRKRIREGGNTNFERDRFVGEDGELLNNYDNPKVKEIQNQLGDYNYGENPNRDQPVEFRPEVQQENHAKYEGEWAKGTDNKQGKGK